jgi:hypothetical protein
MPTHVQHPSFQELPGIGRTYSPDTLPRLQSLLADLADIDFACEKSLKAIERSLGDESLKRRKIAQLWRDHEERRAPYVAALEELQAQARGCFDQPRGPEAAG